MAGLQRRAAVHAALADPARLAITDALADGDASPSELAGMVSMPSNLLAHHLRVLEETGLVTRHRSEGDRRRTYLRLVPGALDALAGPPGRSRGGWCSCAPPTPPARTWPPPCGGGPARCPRSRPAPARPSGSTRARSMPPSATSCRSPGCGPGTSVTSWMKENLVVTVCDLAHEELSELAAVHWSVPDPVPAGDPGSFDAALAELAGRVGRFAPRLAAS